MLKQKPLHHNNKLLLLSLQGLLLLNVGTSFAPSPKFSCSGKKPSNHHHQQQYAWRSTTPTTATSTTLFVSELHVPGYAQTKLPFLADETEYYDSGGIRKVSYQSNQDYTSIIPYEDGHLIHQTTIPILSTNECQAIVEEAELVASQKQWTTNRHGNFPTTDLPLVELPNTLQFLRRTLIERIYPLLRSQFGCYLPEGGQTLRVADGFVVKYDAANGQKELKPHRDGSVLSLNIALNPATDFEGGGTWFASLDDAIKIDQGEIVTHASSLLHGGHGITSGIRYILVAFVIVEGYDNWSMRFYNQVRNY